jgi:2-dehydro-3-deoxygalactonokinase
MDKLLCCDWGTSSLRLRLANTADASVIASVNTAQGIASTFQLWKDTGHSRVDFYLHVIDALIKQIENKLSVSLDGLPLVISGMASASVGMMELPYSTLPFAVDGSGATTHYINSSGHFNHPVLLISGVKSNDDVMRGEETQLVGCMELLDEWPQEQVVIFPGTHSKHVTINNRKAIAITTFMTGEFFELLSNQSILRLAVEKHPDIQSPSFVTHFSTGVTEAVTGNLLNTAFRVRTSELLGKRTKQENYSYLSGLVTGSELKALQQGTCSRITVCGEGGLSALYETALQVINLPAAISILSADKASEAALRGQINIFNQFKR